MISRVQEGDSMAKVMEAAYELYTIRDTYFPENPLDKHSKLQEQSDAALQMLDSIPQGSSSSTLFTGFIFELAVWV